MFTEDTDGRYLTMSRCPITITVVGQSLIATMMTGSSSSIIDGLVTLISTGRA